MIFVDKGKGYMSLGLSLDPNLSLRAAYANPEYILHDNAEAEHMLISRPSVEVGIRTVFIPIFRLRFNLNYVEIVSDNLKFPVFVNSHCISL